MATLSFSGFTSVDDAITRRLLGMTLAVARIGASVRFSLGRGAQRPGIVLEIEMAVTVGAAHQRRRHALAAAVAEWVGM